MAHILCAKTPFAVDDVRGKAFVDVERVLIVETSMTGGMLKSNEGGSALLYGIPGLSNQQPSSSPHRIGPHFWCDRQDRVRLPVSSHCNDTRIWPISASSNFHAHPAGFAQSHL